MLFDVDSFQNCWVSSIMLRKQISVSLQEALKAKNQTKASTLRLILAALKDRDIAERSKGNANGLNDDAILKLLQ